MAFYAHDLVLDGLIVAESSDNPAGAQAGVG
jgi:hypothetical protein